MNKNTGKEYRKSTSFCLTQNFILSKFVLNEFLYPENCDHPEYEDALILKNNRIFFDKAGVASCSITLNILKKHKRLITKSCIFSPSHTMDLSPVGWFHPAKTQWLHSCRGWSVSKKTIFKQAHSSNFNGHSCCWSLDKSSTGDEVWTGVGWKGGRRQGYRWIKS